MFKSLDWCPLPLTPALWELGAGFGWASKKGCLRELLTPALGAAPPSRREEPEPSPRPL